MKTIFSTGTNLNIKQRRNLTMSVIRWRSWAAKSTHDLVIKSSNLPHSHESNILGTVVRNAARSMVKAGENNPLLADPKSWSEFKRFLTKSKTARDKDFVLLYQDIDGKKILGFASPTMLDLMLTSEI